MPHPQTHTISDLIDAYIKAQPTNRSQAAITAYYTGLWRALEAAFGDDSQGPPTRDWDLD